MDAVLFLKERERMFNAGVNYKRSDGCKKCFGRSICLDICDNFEGRFPEYCVEFVEEWSRENPVKTMMMDFFEKFPNAERDDDGTPTVCVEQVGYPKIKIDGIDCNSSCLRCWSRPLEVTK